MKTYTEDEVKDIAWKAICKYHFKLNDSRLTANPIKSLRSYHKRHWNKVINKLLK